MPLNVDIVSAERRLFQGQITELYARSVEGELGILAGHAPVLIGLSTGPLRARTIDGDWVLVAVHRGFLECRDDDVNVLADTAEMVDDIDVARAESARERALQHLAQDDYPGDARFEFERADTRIQLSVRNGQGSTVAHDA